MLNILTLRFPFGTSQQSNTLTVIHDAFQPLSFWNNFMHPPQFQGVAMDTHIYQMFSDQVCIRRLSPSMHLISRTLSVASLSFCRSMDHSIFRTRATMLGL
jgi:glucan 1,3-beta-glucosidase